MVLIMNVNVTLVTQMMVRPMTTEEYGFGMIDWGIHASCEGSKIETNFPHYSIAWASSSAKLIPLPVKGMWRPWGRQFHAWLVR